LSAFALPLSAFSSPSLLPVNGPNPKCKDARADSGSCRRGGL
jgi:hypothetical protein